MTPSNSINQSAKATPPALLLYVIGFVIFLLGCRMVRTQQALLQAREGRLRTEFMRLHSLPLPLPVTTIHAY
ncbi:MAG: hypothetical protein EAZ91_02030 [Cytophagales bacterium]|nr:MAG: hypothetical protein EAZ91_02030 [Cytophagales bacterium]